MLHYLTGDAASSRRLLREVKEHSSESLLCLSAALAALGEHRMAAFTHDQGARLGADARSRATACVEDFLGSSDSNNYQIPRMAVRRWGQHMQMLGRGEFERYGAAVLEAVAGPRLAYEPGAPELVLRSGKCLPLWRGERVGRLVVLFADGHGDALCFGRYLAGLCARADALAVVASRAVLPVLAREFPGVACSALDDCAAALHQADAYAFEWLLPAQSGEGYGRANWITPAPERVAEWRRAAVGATRNVGIAWAGSPSNMWDGTRSIDVKSLEPLFSVPGITWHSLQVGPRAGECPPICRNHAAALRDFQDTAALVANLHLVVSIDTAVANLAGAMGAPLWLLGEHDPDFRWCDEDGRTPWFPSARVFRQAEPGAWAPVIQRVAGELGWMGAATAPATRGAN